MPFYMSLKIVVYFTLYQQNLDRNLNKPGLWVMPLQYAIYDKKQETIDISMSINLLIYTLL